MPDISDLLHDAVPPGGGYDEDDVRRRVDRRRRRRRAGLAAVLAVVVLGAAGAVVSLQDDDARPVVTDEPPTSGRWAAYGATSVAVVGDQVWIGGDGFASLGDGTGRLSMPGPVEELTTGPDSTLWVRGRGFVAAVDTGGTDSHPAGTPPPAAVLGTWSGDATDLVPLPSREVAITSASTGEVVIAKTSAIAELEEVWRIPVRGTLSDIVRTTTGEVWVRCGDGMTEIDVGAQGVKRTEPWSGRLLAPSLDGGIWTTEGGRIVDLAPDDLESGVSVAEGARYQVDATMAVETSFGLVTGGRDGVRRFSSQTPEGEVVTKAVPDALDASGGQIAYVSGGAVHTASVGGDQTSDPEAWRREPRQVAARYLRDELRWPDVVIDRDEETPSSTGNEYRVVHTTSATLQRDADVTVHRTGDTWEVSGLWTFGTEDHPASVSLGNGTDHVGFDYRDAALAPALTVRYGDAHTTMEGGVGADAVWDGDLGFVADTPGFVQVLFRNADGVALEGWATSVPAGPFAAG